MKITEDIIYAGVNDHQVDLFEGQYKVPNGMAYNSYVILDEKTAVMDTVDANFADEWLANVAKALDGRKPDYLIVQHMEPDHSANIENFVKAYPEATVVANTKTFAMMKNFFPKMDLAGRKLEVKDGESLTLGKHVLTFVFAPWYTGRRLWLHTTARTRFCSQQTVLENSVHSTARNHGMTKHAVILSVLSENTVCRYRSS